MQSQFIKAGLIPSAGEIKTFGDPVELFNVKMLTAAPVNAKAASKDFTEFKLTAKVKGVAGNAISITVVDPEVDGDLDISFAEGDPNAIVVTLEKNTTVVTTGTALVAALNDIPEVAALVLAEGTGTDPLTAVAKTNLEGGVNGSYAPRMGVYFIDSSNIYLAVDANGISDANWRKVALGSAY